MKRDFSPNVNGLVCFDANIFMLTFFLYYSAMEKNNFSILKCMQWFPSILHKILPSVVLLLYFRSPYYSFNVVFLFVDSIISLLQTHYIFFFKLIAQVEYSFVFVAIKYCVSVDFLHRKFIDRNNCFIDNRLQNRSQDLSNRHEIVRE
jgi:hypothetical protein